MLRILISTDADVAQLDEAAESNGVLPWVVPKDAMPGETCLFSHMGDGITHMGETKSNAVRNEEPPWKGRYMASVHRITTLAEAVSHDELVDVFPSWKWASYPKMYTSVQGPLADELLDLCADRVAPGPLDLDEFVVTEGRSHLRRHLIHERDPSIVAAKRDEVLKATGGLRCAVCRFDFFEVYGEIGTAFCEVHHLEPLAARYEESETRLQDLAVVCSNCHRMLHRRGLLGVDELRKMLRTGAA